MSVPTKRRPMCTYMYVHTEEPYVFMKVPRRWRTFQCTDVLCEINQPHGLYVHKPEYLPVMDWKQTNNNKTTNYPLQMAEKRCAARFWEIRTFQNLSNSLIAPCFPLLFMGNWMKAHILLLWASAQFRMPVCVHSLYMFHFCWTQIRC